jgi:hypothetical protein
MQLDFLPRHNHVVRRRYMIFFVCVVIMVRAIEFEPLVRRQKRRVRITKEF